MKVYLIFALFLIIGCRESNPISEKTSQKIKEDTIENTLDPYSCDWGKVEANKDFKNDSLMLIRFGLPDSATNYYWHILYSDYHIYTKFSVGCKVDQGIICYNNFMKEKIIKKYGSDIFDKASSKADSLFNNKRKKGS